MVLKKIDLERVQISLEELLLQLEGESEILLTKGDKPIARIAAEEKSKVIRTEVRILGLHEGEGWISDDFTDELDDSFWFGDEE